MIRIPVYKPVLDGNEKKYVNECLDSSWISSRGEFIGRFETAVAEFTGAAHAASVCNGTVALHLALLALGIGPGDEVIVPTLTYIAPVNAITYVGATPVFVDSTRSTWQIDVEDVRRSMTSRTKAILAVHLYGQPCDMPALVELAREHRCFLVEDCAEAFGSRINGQHVGTFGDIGTFSFFGNKTITTGEGGMVISNDKTLHERSVHLKGQGLAEHRQYWHDVVGYNYRMTNIEAAIGLAQIERVAPTLRRKQDIAKLYAHHLKGLPIEMQGEETDKTHSHWMVSMLVENDTLRDPLRDYLATQGIETRPLFYPVHTMPMYARNYARHAVAEDIAWRGLNLPSSPALTDEEVISVCKHIREFLTR